MSSQRRRRKAKVAAAVSVVRLPVQPLRPRPRGVENTDRMETSQRVVPSGQNNSSGCSGSSSSGGGSDTASSSDVSSDSDTDGSDTDSVPVHVHTRPYHGPHTRLATSTKSKWEYMARCTQVSTRWAFILLAAAAVIMVILFFTVFVVGVGVEHRRGSRSRAQRRFGEWKSSSSSSSLTRSQYRRKARKGPFYPWREWGLPTHQDCKGWSIGVGFAHSPLSRVENWTQVFWPELERDKDTEGPYALAADPFLVPVGSQWYMFYEMFGPGDSPGEQIGRIGWASQTFESVLSPWVDGGMVEGLAAGHQSYPYVVFDVDTNSHYMLPQITGELLTLYVSDQQHFPQQWAASTVIDTSSTHYYDSNIVHWQGRWYVFAGLFDDTLDRTYSQRIFVSESGVLGPYELHQAAPLPRKHPAHFGRNGGRMVPFRGGLVRFTQFYFADSHRYGEIVRAAVVSKLTLTEVVEEYDVSWVVSLPADTWPEYRYARDHRAWNAKGAHHVDMHPLTDGRWLVAFDGREACAVTKQRPQFVRAKQRAKLQREQEDAVKRAESQRQFMEMMNEQRAELGPQEDLERDYHF